MATRSPPRVGWRVTITEWSWGPWPSTLGSPQIASCVSAVARRRDLAAWLARELTPVTLLDQSEAFGLTDPHSVLNLIRRANRALLGSRPLCDEIEAIHQRLLKTENQP